MSSASSPVSIPIWACALAFLAEAAFCGTEGGGAEAADDGYTRSVAAVRRVLERHGGVPRLQLALGDVHFRRGRFGDAARVFEGIVESPDGPVDALLRLGATYARMGRTEDAIAAYRKAAAGGSTSARLSLAELLQELERHDEAAAELRRLVSEGAGGAEALYQLGRSLSALLRRSGPAAGDRESEGDADRLEAEAESFLRRAVSLRPRHAPSRYLLAMVLRRQGKREAALAELEEYRLLPQRAAAVDEEKLEESGVAFEARTAVDLARALLESGFPQEAMVEVRRALAVAPDSLEALAYKGWIEMQLGELDQALTSYAEALRRDPRHAEALWNTGRIHLRRGDIARAAPLLHEAVELRERFPEGWELLARLAFEGKAYPERVEEICARALAERPSPESYERVALLEFRKGNVSAAQKLLEDAVRRFPRSERLRTGLEALRRGGAKP